MTPPPNLVVDSIFLFASSFSGQPTTISWRVKNKGLGITPTTTWQDSVHISEDVSFDPTDTLLAIVTHTGELISSAGYDASVDVIVPNGVYGTYHIFVTTDVRNQMYEHTDEEDNRESRELEVLLSPTPDFQIVELVIGESRVKTGDTINIEYTVRNQGAGSPFERWWTDHVTITSKANGRIYHDNKLSVRQQIAPGESYIRSFTYRIPQSVPSGVYTIAVHTDDQNYVFEFEADANNMDSMDVTIEQALPDLQAKGGVITHREAPDATYLEYNISVLNNGQGHLFGASWIDAVYLSKVKIFSPNTLLPGAQHRQSNEVASGTAYFVHGDDLLIPQSFIGQYYVYVATDYEDDVMEESEDNNLKEVGLVDIPKRLGDLVLSNVIVTSDVVTAGDELTIVWEVKNEGTLSISLPWYDSIYLTRGESLDDDAILLGRTPQTGGLAPNKMLSQEMNITIPLETAGFYNLVVQTGEYFHNKAETNEYNNKYATGIQILSPASPDLKVTNVGYAFIENNGMKSRVLPVSVDVTNHGNSFISHLSWTDRVVLQERSFTGMPKEVVGTQTDVSLSLLAQESYTLTHLLVVPAHVNGYFDIVCVF